MTGEWRLMIATVLPLTTRAVLQLREGARQPRKIQKQTGG